MCSKEFAKYEIDSWLIAEFHNYFPTTYDKICNFFFFKYECNFVHITENRLKVEKKKIEFRAKTRTFPWKLQQHLSIVMLKHEILNKYEDFQWIPFGFLGTGIAKYKSVSELIFAEEVYKPRLHEVIKPILLLSTD